MNDPCKDINGYLQPRSRSQQPPPRSEVDLETAQSECGGFSDDFEIPQSGNAYTSLRARKMALRRKRSLSVADLPVQHSGQQGQQTTSNRKQKAEESGYDSDVTRKSSPRGKFLIFNRMHTRKRF